jgi:hypothetical protein
MTSLADPVIPSTSDATATVMVGRYALYISVNFGDEGTAFFSLDDRGSWMMDTQTMTGEGLKARLEVFQNRVHTEIQHILERAASE